MSDFLIDEVWYLVWYDIKSDTENRNYRVIWSVVYSHEPMFWVRLHRKNGPALIKPHKSNNYYIKGQRHREDGPAVEYHNGSRDWWLNDLYYTFEGWCEVLKKSPEEITFLKLKWNIL